MARKDIYLGSGPRDPNLQRSKYDFSFTNHLSAMFGNIYPAFLMELNPDESVDINPHAEFDLMPMVFPLQSNIRMHISFFKGAFRNLWKNYKDVVSGVGSHVWPYIKQSYNWHKTGSLADYMNIPSYSNEDSLGWDSLGTISSEDENIIALGRSYFIGTPDNLTNLHNLGVDVLPGDSLYSFFSTHPMPTSYFDSENPSVYSCILSDLAPHFIAESQPYMLLHIVSPTSTLSKLNPLRFGLIQYQKSDSNLSRYIAYFDPSAYTGETSVASSYSAVFEKTYQVVNLESVSINTGQSCYVITLLAHLSEDFVSIFNELQKDGLCLRFVVAYESTSENESIFGSTFMPFIKPFSSTLNPASPVVQTLTYANGHYSTSTNTFQLTSGGLQSHVIYRTRNSINKSGDQSSPFMVVSPATEPVLPLSALPFRMYEFIYNQYFREPQIDPFIKNGQPTYNQFLTNDGDGADSTTPLGFNRARYEFDYFTTAKFTPQAGQAPLVGITHTEGASDAIFHFVDENDQEFTLKIKTDSTGRLAGIDEYPSNAPESTVKTLNALINYGIDINTFRSVSAFVRYLERKQISNFDYKSVVKEFFGTNAPIGEEYMEYIGGMTVPVNIFKLENQSAAGQLPLGYFAGTGRVSGSLGKHEHIRCYCSERSYIMGLVWFTVTPVYPQRLDKMWTKKQLLEFYNPQFATIGNQPIYNYELAPLQASDTDNLMGVFGYQRPWYEYTMRMDEVHGQFRDSQHNYLLQREFVTIPELGHDFITINPDDLTNVFSYTEGSDKIFGAIRFDVKYNSVVPKFISPRIVG